MLWTTHEAIHRHKGYLWERRHHIQSTETREWLLSGVPYVIDPIGSSLLTDQVETQIEVSPYPWQEYLLWHLQCRPRTNITTMTTVMTIRQQQWQQQQQYNNNNNNNGTTTMMTMAQQRHSHCQLISCQCPLTAPSPDGLQGHETHLRTTGLCSTFIIVYSCCVL